MARFKVFVPEVWIQAVEVEAETKEQAIEQVSGGGGGEYKDDELEYSDTLEPVVFGWRVEEVK